MLKEPQWAHEINSQRNDREVTEVIMLDIPRPRQNNRLLITVVENPHIKIYNNRIFTWTLYSKK